MAKSPENRELEQNIQLAVWEPLSPAVLSYDNGVVGRLATAYRARTNKEGPNTQDEEMLNLHDALSDAGCRNQFLLQHLREPGIHNPNCCPAIRLALNEARIPSVLVMERCNPKTGRIERYNPQMVIEMFENRFGRGWAVWKGEADTDGLEGPEDWDAKANQLAEVNFKNIFLQHCIKEGEGYITGAEKMRRLRAWRAERPKERVLFGGNQFLALWEDLQTNIRNNTLQNSVLEQMRNGSNFYFIDFPVLILRSPDGHRHVPSLYFDGGEWHWFGYWLDDNWGRNSPSASLASVK